jgi:hypothetical protein
MLTVSAEQSAGTACGCYLNEEGVLCYYPFLVKEFVTIPFSLKKKDNSVGSVGCVGKSEKSPEISQ